MQSNEAQIASLRIIAKSNQVRENSLWMAIGDSLRVLNELI